MDSLPQLALDFDEPPTFPSKQCRACGEAKPLAEFGLVPRRHFPEEHRPDTRCKVCRNEYHRQWRMRNPETVHAIRARHAERRKECPKPLPAEKTCTVCRETLPIDRFGSAGTGWGLLARCKACHAAKARRQNKKAPERVRQYQRAYRIRHPDRRKAQKRQDYLRYRDRYFLDAARYRARKYNAPQFERVNRDAIIDRDKSTCYLCGKVLTAGIVLDHVVPLSRGGPHTADNLRVACRLCNGRKCDKLLSELSWYQSQD